MVGILGLFNVMSTPAQPPIYWIEIVLCTLGSQVSHRVSGRPENVSKSRIRQHVCHPVNGTQKCPYIHLPTPGSRQTQMAFNALEIVNI